MRKKEIIPHTFGSLAGGGTGRFFLILGTQVVAVVLAVVISLHFAHPPHQPSLVAATAPRCETPETVVKEQHQCPLCAPCIPARVMEPPVPVCPACPAPSVSMSGSRSSALVHGHLDSDDIIFSGARIARIHLQPPIYLALRPPGDLISDFLYADAQWEPHIALYVMAVRDAAFAAGRGCVVLDVGANMGIHGIYAARLGCRSILFEAQQQLGTLIEMSILLNNVADRVTLVNRPVWDQKLKLYYVPEKSNEGATKMSTQPTGREGELSVESVRVDSVVELDLDVDFVKLDVEHSELQALKSMSGLLASHKIRLIVAETWSWQIDVVKYMTSLGYVARLVTANSITLDPVNDLLITPENFDTLFVDDKVNYKDFWYTPMHVAA